MTSLHAFLLERFAEDESVARHRLASSRRWGKRAAALTLIQRSSDRQTLWLHSGENDRCAERPCEALRELASRYVKHPDYRPEWR